MKYCEVHFRYEASVDTEIINDILAAELGNIGFESFTSESDGLKAYIAENAYSEDSINICLNTFPVKGVVFNYTTAYIEQTDWNEEWEKNYFQPVRIGDECLVRASFHPDEPGFQYKIIIDPKMAFGTGNHSTTYLMISEILHLDIFGKDILDMGCGTAVLAILARMKGARHVVAIDIDEWAYENAIENCQLNNAEDIILAKGGAELIPEYGTFDFIFANINRNILLNDINRYFPALKSGGQLLMSGFYRDDIPVIKAECEKYGMTIISVVERNEWVAMRAKV